MLSSHCFKPSSKGMKPLHSPPAWAKDHRAVWRQAGRGTSSALWIQECLEEVANTYLGSLLDSQCLPQRSAKHRKAAERGCWFWSGWQRRSRERWRRAKLCHGVMLGKEWDQHCERGPQPCIPLWESLVWEHSAAQGRARQRYWQELSMDP